MFKVASYYVLAINMAPFAAYVIDNHGKASQSMAGNIAWSGKKIK